MNFWRDIISRLWNNRLVRPYAASPSKEQVANAEMILGFAATEAWGKYSEYLYVSLGEAMEQSFSSLKKGDANAVMVYLSRADAIYSLLTETHSALSIMEKNKQVIITPQGVAQPRRGYVPQG